MLKVCESKFFQALNKDLVSFPTPVLFSPKVKGKRGLKRYDNDIQMINDHLDIDQHFTWVILLNSCMQNADDLFDNEECQV